MDGHRSGRGGVYVYIAHYPERFFWHHSNAFPLKKYSKGLEEDREQNLEYSVKSKSREGIPAWRRGSGIVPEQVRDELFSLQKTPREN